MSNTKIVMPPDTETCGCCAGIDASTPTDITNRIGLSAISYRIGDYAQFKDSMIAGLSSSAYPALAGLRTRDADDYTLGLLDAVACAADVLTFYQERLANESYLRTATERVSLQEMGKLIGYQLRPGVAAETWLSFALEPPKTPPPNLPAEPGHFVTGIPLTLSLDAGLQVQSVPGPGELPQTFETVEALFAKPQWNGVRPWLAASRLPARGDTEIWIQGLRNNLKAGDALVFAGDEFMANPTANNNWDFRLIDSVVLETDQDRTHVKWKRGLGSFSPPSNPSAKARVYVMRKRAAVFGNNAPLWRSMNLSFRQDYAGATHASDGEWPDFTTSALSTNTVGGYVDLDGVATDATNGSLVVLAKGEFNRPSEGAPRGTYVELYKVTSTTEVSRAQFAMSGKVTRLGITGQNLAEQFRDSVAVRDTSVYLVSEELQLAAYPVVDAVVDSLLPLALAIDDLSAGRRLVVNGIAATGGAAVVHQTSVTAMTSNPNGVILGIAPPLPVPLLRSSVVVHVNVALATHGETVAQILGQGDASQAFQRFELKRTPLTYRSADNETGAKSELSVRIGDVEWTEEPTLFGAQDDDRAYAVQSDEQGKTWVVFGDGVRGARLPSGVNNVRAQYRQGLGEQGNVGQDKLTQLMTRPLGLKSVSNPVAAQGGTDPEPADQARRTMPLGTRTLGRAVSLLDYEDFALAFTGVAKAQAQVLQLPAGPTIAITLAGQHGAAISTANPIWTHLWNALKASGDPYVKLALMSYQASTFRLGLKVKRDPAYELKPLLAAVEAALRAHFSFDARELGQPVLQSDVIAVAHTVPGVVAIDLDFLYGGTAPLAQTLKSRQTRLLASRMRVLAGTALAAELLTLDGAPFDRLEEMTS